MGQLREEEKLLSLEKTGMARWGLDGHGVCPCIWQDCCLHSIRVPCICADVLVRELKRESVDYLAFAGREQVTNPSAYGGPGVPQQSLVAFIYFFIYWHKYPLFDYFDRNQPNQCSEHGGLLSTFGCILSSNWLHYLLRSTNKNLQKTHRISLWKL